MQGHRGVLRRTGAAHAAKAIIADQDSGAQAPADVTRRPGYGLGPPWKSVAPVALAGEDLEGAQCGVPRPEAPFIGRAGKLREAAALGELAPCRLPAELAPDVGEVLEQRGVGHLPELRHRQAGCAKCCIPRAEAACERARSEGAVLGIEDRGHAAPAGLARDTAQVPDQLAVGNVAVLEPHEFYHRGRHPQFLRDDGQIANYGRY
jgi:hypothetical protein